MVTDTAISKISSHFSSAVSEELAAYVRETVFLSSRYLFVWRVGKIQMGYCTHCETEIPIGNGQFYVKHNEVTTCLNCSSQVKVKSRGRGRSKLIDDAYFVWYEKSAHDPNVIVAKSMYAVRDYRENFHAVETKYTTIALYVFEPSTRHSYGRALMFKKSWDNREWKESKSVYSLYKGFRYRKVFCSIESIEAAVLETPFQYSTWRDYENETFDWLDFFVLAAKYPCIEYLTKLGLKKLVIEKLCGRATYGAIYWRGRTIEKVLRLSKHEVKQLRSATFTVCPLTLYSHQYFKRRGVELTLEEAHVVKELTREFYEKRIDALSDYATIEEATRYILKQIRRDDVPKFRRSAKTILTDWIDYIRECNELGMNLKMSHVLYPTSLHKAHANTMKKIKIKQDASLNVLIADRFESLKKYIFTDGTFLIRPAKDSIELFEEGKALNHCVGGYAVDYAEGTKDLFVVRMVDSPETPFCTVEVIEHKIRQARLKDNHLPTDDIIAFLERFTSNKLKTKSNRRKDRERVIAV
ncbi:PcfJ domain-containing protein [Alicyclobacillus fodiniaquatilis]|uniref:PcfJ domain-containing protein n=1 Tax=Alicyclobacillus fodiniaquatilis TaxID=1661150 RepID=A0ABW4JCK7_9BACL